MQMYLWERLHSEAQKMKKNSQRK